MTKTINANSKKSNNAFYYTTFSLIALSSCLAIVALAIAPHAEPLASVAVFATPAIFVALAIPLAISIFAILYKAFSKSNTISKQEDESAQNEQVVEEGDNAGQPDVVASPIHTQELASQQIIVPEQISGMVAGSMSGSERPNPTEGGNPKDKQGEQFGHAEGGGPNVGPTMGNGNKIPPEDDKSEKAKGCYHDPKSSFTPAEEWGGYTYGI